MKGNLGKNPPLKYLIYSELVLAQRKLRIGALMAGILLISCLVVQCSITYGNLGKYFFVLSQPVPAYLVVIVSMLPFMTAESISENTILDTKANWIKFRRSTPASPVRLVLAKYLLQWSILAILLMLSAVSLSILKLLGSTAVTLPNIKLGLMLGLCMYVASIVMQLAMLLLRSVDMAGIVFSILLCAIILPFAFKFSKISDSMEGEVDLFGELTSMISGYFGLVVVVSVIAVILGFVGTVLIFKRRER